PSKLSKKQKKALKDAHRPLDSWERYRALTDVLDEAIDLVDLADHKARFALVIMAALNVVLFFVAVRTDLAKEIPKFVQPVIGVFLAVGLVGLAALSTVIGTARQVTRAATRGQKILGAAERIESPGVKEPSGIAFYPPSGHLFVVGDEGMIAELDDAGKVVKTTKI